MSRENTSSAYGISTSRAPGRAGGFQLADRVHARDCARGAAFCHGALDFQSSECLIEEVVWKNTERITAGETLEPITVRFDGESYFVQDGFHRVEAARRCGLCRISMLMFCPAPLKTMDAEFREGLEIVKADLRR
jgi:hypothetical protein